jgi:hypothetical protein
MANKQVYTAASREPAMKKAVILGWIAVGMASLVSSLWAFWGVYESFHEGWYFKSLSQNLALTVGYLAMMLVLVALSVLALRWPRTGGGLYQLFGVGFCVWILMTRRILSFNHAR